MTRRVDLRITHRWHLACRRPFGVPRTGTGGTVSCSCTRPRAASRLPCRGYVPPCRAGRSWRRAAAPSEVPGTARSAGPRRPSGRAGRPPLDRPGWLRGCLRRGGAAMTSSLACGRKARRASLKLDGATRPADVARRAAVEDRRGPTGRDPRRCAARAGRCRRRPRRRGCAGRRRSRATRMQARGPIKSEAPARMIMWPRPRRSRPTLSPTHDLDVLRVGDPLRRRPTRGGGSSNGS